MRINVAPDTYAKVDVEFKWTITWDPSDPTPRAQSDEVLTVVNKDAQGGGQQEGGQQREVGSSDGPSTTEQVVRENLPSATYQAQACPFASAPPDQPYTGTLTITTRSVEPSLAAGPSNGLSFSASVPADPQRDEGEPLMEVDPDGNTYTCGPTGFSNAADYAQVSTDGARQFHLLGEPPRGQQSIGGGGDCGLGTAPVRNPQGLFNYAYSGLGGLTNFAVAASSDTGHTLNPNPSSNSVPGVDRQWNTFVDADSVLLSYNQQAPRQVVVQRSDDGGLVYQNAVPATPVNPSFPGPMQTLPASQNPTGSANGRPAYFSWNDGTKINFAVSFDEGTTWNNCRVATAPGEPTLFTTSDADSSGNIYVAYGENAKFHTYVTSLPHSKLADCNEQVVGVTQDSSDFPTTNPGWSTPVQVDREGIRSTVFPWLVAGGAPGHVAVAFYGSETDGDPNSGEFKGSWNVYVNQSSDALGSGADFSQVKATTHPIHYDSICLNGLGCAISGGDRSLADFFAIGYDAARKKLVVVYDTTYKRPGDAEGSLATPQVLSQETGPSNGGGSVDTGAPPALRSSSDDATGDAISDYSSLGTPPTPNNEPAADFESVKVSPEASGGFTVTMKLKDLSDAALQQALARTKSQRLLWIFRWFNGQRSAAAVARYDTSGGFGTGFNGFVVGSAQCGSSGDKCLQYPGDEPITGKVDQAAGTITLNVPKDKLKALSGSEGPGQRPQEVPAKAGDRLYDGTAFSLADFSATGGPDQSFLYPLDNAPSMDFLVPSTSTSASSSGSAGAGSSGVPAKTAAQLAREACLSKLTFRSVSVAPSASRARLGFSRRGSGPVQVDVFQQSKGRTIRGERLVARFSNRSRSFTWNGRANRPGKKVTDGYLFVRFKTGAGRGEARRVALRRVRGRLSLRPAFQRRDTCDLLTSFKLERPVFGGRTARPLGIAYRLGLAGRVTVMVTRGSRTVKRYTRTLAAGARTQRIRLSAKGLPTGDYRVRLQARSGGQTTTAALVARRL